MKKIFKIEVDCANCANKMEQAASKIPGVAEISITFMTGKMAVTFAEGANPASVLKDIVKVCKKVDRDFEIIG